MTNHTRHLHLLPIISFIPLILALVAITTAGWYLDPLFIGFATISYIAVNIIYRALHGSFQVSYVVEYSLLGLIAYFVLTQYA
jgi:hypothetical protein